jgi:CDP-diacylglycerol--glycerol-3-phosphate 3-phosphatidyltransferase
MNLATVLTLLRLALLPLIVLLFFIPAAWAAWTCLALYIAGAVTDWLDGWIARRFNQVTPFGTFLDPVSDKIFVITIMLMLVAVGRIPGGWVLCVVAIVVREFLVSGLREFLGPKNIQLPVSPLAKWKTTTQMVTVGILIVAPYVWGATVLGFIGLLAATVLTVMTGWTYLKGSWAYIGFRG